MKARMVDEDVRSLEPGSASDDGCARGSCSQARWDICGWDFFLCWVDFARGCGIIRFGDIKLFLRIGPWVYARLVVKFKFGAGSSGTPVLLTPYILS
jgi:hypothetical protein